MFQACEDAHCNALVGVTSQLENGCQAMADSLLVLVPHKTFHGKPQQGRALPVLTTDIIKHGAGQPECILTSNVNAYKEHIQLAWLTGMDHIMVPVTN